jgi:hypothetical protein
MTLRYKLRTLLLLLAVLPPLLWFGWTKYEVWKAEQERLRLLREIPNSGTVVWTTSDLEWFAAPSATKPEEPRE